MRETENEWEEDDSATFIALGDIFTPSRAEQVGTVAALVPAEPGDRFTVIDLACGAGSLSEAIAQRFSECSVLALDGSPAMLEHTRRRLARFGSRVTCAEFDLHAEDWLRTMPNDTRCVVSSLAIHHLDGPAKRRLFQNICTAFPSGGALLIVDIVEPLNTRAWTVYGDAWDTAVRHQSLATSGSLDAYEKFDEGWNHYRTPDLEFDKPSGLADQLEWLKAAGFGAVDCFWLRAGHAVYGGYK